MYRILIILNKRLTHLDGGIMTKHYLNIALIFLLCTCFNSQAVTIQNMVVPPVDGEYRLILEKDDNEQKKITVPFTFKLQKKSLAIPVGRYSITLETWRPDENGQKVCQEWVLGGRDLSDSHIIRIDRYYSFKTGWRISFGVYKS
jgi:hypothetical protein